MEWILRLGTDRDYSQGLRRDAYYNCVQYHHLKDQEPIYNPEETFDVQNPDVEESLGYFWQISLGN